jgi:integrase
MRGLTDIAIRNLKPAVTRKEIPDPGQRGLYVVIQPTGARSFAVRYRYGGKPRKLTLTGGISLAAARKAASDALYEVEQGRDPSEAKKITKAKAALAQADTVQAICQEYLAREGHKLRTASSREATLTRLVFPEIGNQTIHTLRRSQLIRLLDRIEDQNGERSADIVLAYLSRVFNWHAGRSDEFRTPIVRGMRRRNTKEHARNRILSDDELRSVWQAADAGPFGCFVKFLLLTGARRGEAAAISWKEINGVAEWTLPAARNKTKVDLVRPLSAAAQQELSKLPKHAGTDFAFSMDGHSALGGFTRRKRVLDQASGVTGWTLHDLRRTARSLMARAGVQSEHAERCLGHVISGVEGTYNRHDYVNEMRIAYEKLAVLIAQIVDPQPNVVAMTRS